MDTSMIERRYLQREDISECQKLDPSLRKIDGHFRSIIYDTKSRIIKNGDDILAFLIIDCFRMQKLDIDVLKEQKKCDNFDGIHFYHICSLYDKYKGDLLLGMYNDMIRELQHDSYLWIDCTNGTKQYYVELFMDFYNLHKNIFVTQIP